MFLTLLALVAISDANAKPCPKPGACTVDVAGNIDPAVEAAQTRAIADAAQRTNVGQQTEINYLACVSRITVLHDGSDPWLAFGKKAEDQRNLELASCKATYGVDIVPAYAAFLGRNGKGVAAPSSARASASATATASTNPNVFNLGGNTSGERAEEEQVAAGSWADLGLRLTVGLGAASIDLGGLGTLNPRDNTYMLAFTGEAKYGFDQRFGLGVDVVAMSDVDGGGAFAVHGFPSVYVDSTQLFRIDAVVGYSNQMMFGGYTEDRWEVGPRFVGRFNENFEVAGWYRYGIDEDVVNVPDPAHNVGLEFRGALNLPF